MKQKRIPFPLKQMTGYIQKAGAWFCDLLYPPRCPICDELLPPGEQKICPSCEKKLPWVEQPYCMKCGKMLTDPRREYCPDCMRYPHSYDRGIAAFCYTGPMRLSVGRMKFANRREYLDFYAEAMVSRGAYWIRRWQPDAIVPVPMHWKKKNRRGYNQAELLAVKIGRLTGIPVQRKLVRKCRDTRNQKYLSAQERRKNLSGAFAVRRWPEGLECVLLVDDVYTTGSTMDAMADILRKCGVKYIYFLTLCIGKDENIVCSDEKM
jgi:ComF family protein